MSERKIIVGCLVTAFILFSGSCDREGEDNPVTQGGGKVVYGTFRLFLDADQEKSSFLGKLYDGPIFSNAWDTIMAAGECMLVKPKNAVCNDCGSGFVCVDDNDCQPEPDTITAGTIHIQGITNRGGSDNFTVDPINGNYQPIGDSRPVWPGFAEGNIVTLTAAGSDSCQGFTLSAETISPIEKFDDTISLNPGEPVDLEWVAAAGPANSRIYVSIDISYHGGTKARIEADCEDDGQLSIPASMIDSLMSFGISGHPKLEITRRATGRNATTGVTLVFESYSVVWLKIPGVVSCIEGQCPEGMECNWDQRCREIVE